MEARLRPALLHRRLSLLYFSPENSSDGSRALCVWLNILETIADPVEGFDLVEF